MENSVVHVEDGMMADVIGIRYDTRPHRGVLTVGGHTRNLAAMERIMANFGFDAELYKTKWTARNKVTLTVRKVERPRYLAGMDIVRAHFSVTLTKAMGRVWR